MTWQNVCRPVGATSGDRTNDPRSNTSNPSRREFLANLAAFGLTAATPARRLIARTPEAGTLPGKVDFHHHVVPPFYVAENRDRIVAAGGGRLNPAYFGWTPEQALAAMDKNGVATAILSLSPGGFWFGDREAAARTARRVNEYAADLMRTHPSRFGLFAIIPLPDTEASLREIEYAYSVLKADGIGLATNYDDKWLGHPDYQPVFEELNRRKSVVFVHPATSSCCQTLLPDVSPMLVEVPQETARAVTNLLFTGTFSRFKDIRFIFTHAGGNVPMLLGRMHQYGPKNIAEKAPNGIEYELNRLYYDIAGTAYRPAIAALTALVPTTQILFGSDNPFVPLPETADGIMQLGFSGDDLSRIARVNAATLLPRLKAS
ncbi:MAG TPA: amidohydrolase family protein [Candidatus Acidoferrum sp.]|nr:amidohydrolase family protein [Candidatus Acidoferrum sp.]